MCRDRVVNVELCLFGCVRYTNVCVYEWTICDGRSTYIRLYLLFCVSSFDYKCSHSRMILSIMGANILSERKSIRKSNLNLRNDTMLLLTEGGRR